MARIAYVDGAYRPITERLIEVEDRGYQFADGVYEVCLVVDDRLWDDVGHFRRWRRSLSELGIDEPMSEAAMRAVIWKLLRLNRLSSALVYLQATRGVAPRNHAYPLKPAPPRLVATARPFSLAASNRTAAKGVSVITMPDIRWGRVDIKSISLLPNVMAKDAARRAGAVEAWLHHDGVVTEGASSNAWIVTDEGALITHPVGTKILGGITRETVIDCVRREGLEVVERAFTLDEARAASEAFITSATNLVTPVIAIDSEKVGDGAPGPVATRLRNAYIRTCTVANSRG